MRKWRIQDWDDEDHEEEEVVETDLLGKKCLYHLIRYLQQGDTLQHLLSERNLFLIFFNLLLL